MSALTMTLLPDPVAPAMSRWGILARSTAWALPATSRPRAKVSVEPEALKSTSSRIRRRATMLKSLFGISMPTALLPGIGASMRSERAASAMARSSASASIRLTLMSGAGWTSYCVTTGPALRPVIWAGMLKLASFLTMISSVRLWAASSPPAETGVSMSSRIAVEGSTYSMRSCVGGESLASVTSSGSRTARRATSAAGRTATSVPAPARAGAKVAEVGTELGIAAGMSVRCGVASAPQMPVWPADAPAATPTALAPATAFAGLPLRPLPGAALPGPTGVPAPLPGEPSRSSAAAPVCRSQAMNAVNGAMSWASRRLNASIRPPAIIARSTTRAPGAVSRGSSTPWRNRPTRPPFAPRTSAAPTNPV